MLRWNPQSGRMEDDGTESPGLDLTPPATVAPVSVRQPQGPITIIPPGEEPPAPETPPAPVAPAPPVAAEPPAMSKVESKTTTTREVPTKAEAGLNQKIAGEFSQQAGLTRKEGEINQREAASAATGAEEAAKASGERQAAMDKTIAEHTALVKQAQDKVTADRAKYDAEVTRLGQMDVKGYYEGNEGHGRALGNAIAVALGEIGKIVLKNRNGTNPALASIHDQEDQYYKAQRSRIDQQKEKVAAAKEGIGLSQGGLTDARQAKLDQLADLNLQFAARSQAIADKFKAEGARIGTEHALVTADKMAAAEEQRRDMFLEGYQQSIRAKVTSEHQDVSGTGTGGGANGKAFGRQSDLALFGTEVDQNSTGMDKVGLSHAGKIAALKRVQDNETNLKRIENDHSVVGGLLTNAGRSADMLPRSRLNGLTDAQKQWIAMNDVREKKIATLLEKSTAPSAQHSALDKVAFNPDDSPQSMANKMEEGRRIARETIAMAAGTGKVAQRAAGGQGVAPGPAFVPGTRAPEAPAPAPAVSAQDQAAIQWANAHKQDPRAQRILQLHGM